MSRSLYGRAELEPLIAPRSIAIVGASPRAGSFGLRTLENLAHFRGNVFPVNAKYEEIGGLACHASLAALPGKPDCVLLAVPREAVETALEEAAAAGARSVIVYASGYGEMDREESSAAQRRLAQIARAARTGQGDARVSTAGSRSPVLKSLSNARKTLTEREAKTVLAHYGIACVPQRRAKDAEEAVRAAEEIGYPVVLKADSPDITHKTEAGAVRLDLRDEEAVRAACAAMAVAKEGFLVQPMVTGGIEMIVGTRRDPQVGPILLVGLGGVLVEIMRDTALSLAPVGMAEARRMLERLRGFRLLEGYRGAPAADLDAVCDAIARVSELAADFSDRIEEIDVNPLLARPDGAIALDALIVLRQE